MLDLDIFDNLIENAEKDGEEDSYEFQIFKCLAMKNLGLPYDIEKLQALIEKEELENPTWKEKMWHVTALELFNLLGDRDYINVAHKELDHLFSYMGDFEIINIEAANSIDFIDVLLPFKTNLGLSLIHI